MSRLFTLLGLINNNKEASDSSAPSMSASQDQAPGYALEPRILFDGAGAITAIDALDHQPTDTHTDTPAEASPFQREIPA